MKLLLTFTLIVFTMLGRGQYEYYVPSPQTSDFVKYGNIPVSHYTGNLGLQIPVYNHSDKDFNIDVSIGYNSSGFVPNKQPGIIGMNFFLNAGGVITRDIKGIPDDRIGHPESANQSPFVHGLWYGLKRDQDAYSSANIFSFNEGQATTHMDWALGDVLANYYETTSDIYSFNFMGCRGKFIIGQDKEAHVFGIEGSNTFDVDLTGYSDQFDDMNYPNNSTIIIKTGDGYKYTFGGSNEKLEYRLQVDIDSELGSDPAIVSWYLAEIEVPHGRKVNFAYRPFTEIYPVTRDTFNYILNIYPKSYSSYYDTYTSYSWLVSHFNSSGYISNVPTYELLKTVYLEKIIIDNDCEISFSYSEKEKKFYQTVVTGYTLYEQKNLKLDSIVVKSFDNIVKKAYFNYSYKGNLNKERLFLDALEIQGQEPYTFDYVSGNFPSPITRGIDYWGFWNGIDDEHADLIPLLSLDESGNLLYTSNERSPNTSNGVFNLGLLNKVTYPTGGYALIEYEPHRYTQKLDRRSDNHFLPKLYNTEDYAGGARVKKITDFDGANQYNEREFIYKKNYDPNILGSGTSSGILLNWPRFIYAFSSTFYPGHNATNVVHTNSLGISINATDDEYITYSSVVEKKSDHTYSEFIYSNYISNPDDTIQNSMNTWITGNYVTNPYDFYVNIYRQPNCKSYERGKLTRKLSYSSNGDLVSDEIYHYGRWGNENYVASILLSGDKFYSRKDYLYSNVLKQDTIRIYSLTEGGSYSNDFVQTVTEYNYNSLNLNSLKKIQNSDHKWRFEEYYYPNDYSAVENFQALIYKNIINKVIDTRVYINNQLISGTQTKYNNYGLPTDIYSAEISPGVIDIPFSAGNPYLFTHKASYEYNSDYTLKKVAPEDNVRSYYIWGYNKQYMVAKIESSTNTTISVTANDNNLSKSDEFNAIKNDVLYLKGLLAGYINNEDYMVTLYTYKPLFGMTSQTDANGVTTYYEYDSFGRLKCAKNDDGDILQWYDYHYADQN